MKSAGIFALLFSFAIPVFAAEPSATAYTALRVVGKQKGATLLNRVVEMRGRAGSPEPAVWKIVVTEPGARGGVREFEVQRGRIISERTPVARGPVGEAMDFSRLNLDSEGVFKIVNQETGEKGVSFDRIDYALRSGTGGGSPVWTADLFNGREGQVSSLQIAADTGAVLRQGKASPPPPVASRDRDDVRSDPLPPPRNVEEDNVYREPGVYRKGAPQIEYREYSDGRWSQPGEDFRGLGDFFHRLGKRFERRGEHLENFFTGKSGGGR